MRTKKRKVQTPERKRQQGFTLLEVLLALVIFAMFSISAYAVLQGVMKNDDVARQKIARLTELQTAMTSIEQDLTQIVARTWRQDGENLNMVLYQGKGVVDSDGDVLMFIRAGWLNPEGRLRRSELRKVGYRLQNGNLERLSWNYPDTAPGADVQKTTLLTRITAFKVRFYLKGQWVTHWTDTQTLPAAIEFSLTLADYAEIHRRFLVANGATS